jgi:hypothetical protein
MRLVLFIIFVIVLLPSLSNPRAAMYSYVDEFGRLHFTNVPADPRYKEDPGFDARDIRKTLGLMQYGRLRFRGDTENLSGQLLTDTALTLS